MERPRDNSLIDLKDKKAVFEYIKNIGRLFYLSSIELLAVAYGIKPAMAEANTGIYNDSTPGKLRELGKICSNLGFKMAFSRKKYIINSPQGIFKEIELEDPRDGNLIIGIAREQGKALSAVAHYHWKMLSTPYGRSFGKLMGYPECCLDFGDYLANNNNDADNFGFRNPAVETLKRSKKIDWRLNTFIVSILPHFPCTFECKESRKYADALLKVLSEADPDSFADIKDTLQNGIALYWSCADRIILQGDFKKKGLGFQNCEVEYHSINVQITSDRFYQQTDTKYLKQLTRVEETVEKGNRIVMTPGYFEIFKDKTSILKINKTNPWKPVLAKSDYP